MRPADTPTLTHYMHWYGKTGSLEIRDAIPPTLESRFQLKLPDTSNPTMCWEWQGTKTIYGYSQLAFKGKL